MRAPLEPAPEQIDAMHALRLHRLRVGELIAGASAVALLVFMFLLPWYGAGPKTAPTRAAYSVNGWHGLIHVRWLVLLTIAVSLWLVVVQAARRAPALPVAMSLTATVLGVLTALVLIYRVLIDVPGAGAGQRAGAFLGLISAVGLAIGAYKSLRREGISPADGPGEIERVAIGCGRS